MRELPALEVAVAVIEREGKLLISQRKPGDSLGGLWEFPGGKRREGETLEACLVRELQEELALTVEVGAQRRVIEHAYPQRTIRLHCFQCRILQGEPRALDCAAWRWVSPQELKQEEFPPASRPLIEELKR